MTDLAMVDHFANGHHLLSIALIRYLTGAAAGPRIQMPGTRMNVFQERSFVHFTSHAPNLGNARRARLHMARPKMTVELKTTRVNIGPRHFDKPLSIPTDMITPRIMA